MAPIVPTLRRERVLWRAGAARVAGVDEVGVAPACGPVVAAAVIVRPNARRIPGVRDSKTLSAAQREALAPEIRRRAVAVGVGAASVARDRPPEHLPRDPPGDAPRPRPPRRPRSRAGRRPADRRLRGGGRSVRRHRRRRRARLHDRLRVGRGEGRPRPAHDPPGRSPPRLRLGAQRRLRDRASIAPRWPSWA